MNKWQIYVCCDEYIILIIRGVYQILSKKDLEMGCLVCVVFKKKNPNKLIYSEKTMYIFMKLNNATHKRDIFKIKSQFSI